MSIRNRLRSAARAWCVFTGLLCLHGVWATQVWYVRDIGDTGAAGSAHNVQSTIIMSGAGRTLDGEKPDAFRFLYQRDRGDKAIIARVVSLDGTDPQAKAGVMIRAGSDATACNVCLAVTPQNGLSLLWRTAKGECGSESVLGLAPPCWLKLVRHTGSVAGFYSADGAKWTPLGAALPIDMGDPVSLGMAVTSNVYGDCCTAVFDHAQLANALGADELASAPQGGQPSGAARLPNANPAAPSGAGNSVASFRHTTDLLTGLSAGTVPNGQSGWTRDPATDTNNTRVVFINPDGTSPAAPCLKIYAYGDGLHQYTQRDLGTNTGLAAWKVTGQLRFDYANLLDKRTEYRILVNDAAGNTIARLDRFTWDWEKSDYLHFNEQPVVPDCTWPDTAAIDKLCDVRQTFTIEAIDGNVKLSYGDKVVTTAPLAGSTPGSPKTLVFQLGFTCCYPGETLYVDSLTFSAGSGKE